MTDVFVNSFEILEQRRIGTLTSNGGPPGSRLSVNDTVAVLDGGVVGVLSSGITTKINQKF